MVTEVTNCLFIEFEALSVGENAYLIMINLVKKHMAGEIIDPRGFLTAVAE